MALRFDWKKNLPKIGWGLIILIFLVFFLRVAIWEGDYYARMEGSARTEADTRVVVPGAVENIDETDVDETMRLNHVVSPDRPRFLTIEKLGISSARILPMSVSKEGRLQTPSNIFDVGWYLGSDKPGTGGTMLLDGHNGGPTKEGVFKHLPDLSNGDIIMVERGDGRFFRYEVVENKEVPLSESDSYMKKAMESPVNGKEALTIISCTGVWSQVQQTYLSRQFTRAVLIETSTDYTPTEIKNELKENREKKEKEEKEKKEQESQENSILLLEAHP